MMYEYHMVMYDDYEAGQKKVISTGNKDKHSKRI